MKKPYEAPKVELEKFVSLYPIASYEDAGDNPIGGGDDI
jgi:hypothetical protein